MQRVPREGCAPRADDGRAVDFPTPYRNRVADTTGAAKHRIYDGILWDHPDPVLLFPCGATGIWQDKVG